MLATIAHGIVCPFALYLVRFTSFKDEDIPQNNIQHPCLTISQSGRKRERERAGTDLRDSVRVFQSKQESRLVVLEAHPFRTIGREVLRVEEQIPGCFSCSEDSVRSGRHRERARIPEGGESNRARGLPGSCASQPASCAAQTETVCCVQLKKLELPLSVAVCGHSQLDAGANSEEHQVNCLKNWEGLAGPLQLSS